MLIKKITKIKNTDTKSGVVFKTPSEEITVWYFLGIPFRKDITQYQTKET